MKFLITISLRNLLRQKRRNIFLGSAIAFGMMILVVANSFSHGISDVLFNKIVTYVAGQVRVSADEGKGRQLAIFRDRERLLKIIKENSFDVEEVNEGIGTFLRAVGNGKAENMVLVGVDMSKSYTPEQTAEYNESFHVEDGGSFLDLNRTDVENPVLLPKVKAKLLNVKKNDIIRIRTKNIFGQTQSARLTVVGVLTNDNIFMSGVMFTEMKNIKAMLGYRPWECGPINLKFGNAQKNSKTVADKIHAALTCGRAFIAGDIRAGGASAKGTVIPYMEDDESKKLISGSFKLVAGKMDDVTSKHGVMISKTLARRIGAWTESKIEISYKPKFEKENAHFTTTVKGVFEPTEETGADTIYMSESVFYPHFYESIPDLVADAPKAFEPKKDAAFASALGKEWILLKRSHTTTELEKKMREEVRRKTKASRIDVNSMYESASAILKLEQALTFITVGAMLVIFFIILVGVVNTLRMTIRERTREIGTMRAIGMQRKDVRSIFMLETGFLALFSSLAGTVISFIIMGLLMLIRFSAGDNLFSILLVNSHLHFVPTVASIVIFIIVIVFITLVTSYLPARRASKLSAADALRHYE
jgi:ABC-type lipoprotein release transport system permease subunit